MAVSDAPTQPSRSSSYRRGAPPLSPSSSFESSAAVDDHHHHLVSSSGRMRLKRKIFDPSFPPPSKRKSTTNTRGRLRRHPPSKQIPPASTPSLVIPDQDSNKANDPHAADDVHVPTSDEAEDNHPIPSTKDQPEELTTLTRPSPSTCQGPNKKLEEQVSQVVKETTCAPSPIEVPNTGTLNISSREETRGVSDQAIHNLETSPYHVANVVEGLGKSLLVEAKGSFLSYCSVNLSLAPILQAITKKYGDIAKESPLKSDFMRTVFLEAICKIVQDLKSKKLAQLDINRVHDYYSILEDAETMGFNVKWLLSRLDTLREAAISLTETKTLTDELNQCMQSTEQLKKDLHIEKLELGRLEHEIGEQECKLEMKTLHVEKLDKKIKTLTARYVHLATDGLL